MIDLIRGCILRYAPSELWLEDRLRRFLLKHKLSTAEQIREVMQTLISERDNNWAEARPGDLFFDCSEWDDVMASPRALILSVQHDPIAADHEVQAVVYDRKSWPRKTSIERLRKHEVDGCIRYRLGEGTRIRTNAYPSLRHCYEPRPRSDVSDIKRLLVDIPRESRGKGGIIWAAQGKPIPDDNRALALLGRASWIGKEGAEAVVAFLLGHEPCQYTVAELCQDWCSFRYGLRPGDILIREGRNSTWVFEKYNDSGAGRTSDLVWLNRSRVAFQVYEIRDEELRRGYLSMSELSSYRTMNEEAARAWRRVAVKVLRDRALERHAEEVRLWSTIQQALWGSREVALPNGGGNMTSPRHLSAELLREKRPPDG